jgi:hypothetical protein
MEADMAEKQKINDSFERAQVLRPQKYQTGASFQGSGNLKPTNTTPPKK